MNIGKIAEILHAKIVAGEDLVETNIKTACGSDLMSDVLAFVNKQDGVLLTGLVNPQVVRTADMLDMRGIIFVRGKMPDQDIIALANERNIALLSTQHRLYEACGILYEAGLRKDSSQ